MLFDILTDAGANFIGNAVSRYRVPSLCFPCLAGGRYYRSVNTGNAKELIELYRRLGADGQAATERPSGEAYKKLFEAPLKSGRDILYVGFSSTLSGAYYVALNAANILRESYPNRKIYCFNSHSASMGQGMLVEYACALKEGGASILEVYDKLCEKKRRVRHLFTLDSPDRLLKNGRMQSVNYNPDSAFNIKPLIRIDEHGRLSQIAGAHGKPRAIGELARAVAAEIVEPKEQTVYIAHANCAEDAWALREQIAVRVPVKRIVADYLDPALAAHTGPGALGVFYFAEQR